jgi:RND family efflux transporter MFP subunit
MKRFITVLAGVVLVFVTVVQVRAMRATPAPAPALRPSTDARISAEGRLVAYPGAEATLGSDIAGTIEAMHVIEKQRVRKGQTIALIRAEDTRAELAEAKARVGEAEADIRLYELERDRAQSLWHTAVGSKQAWERAERDLDSARARRASNLASVRQLEAVLSKTMIKSPIDGVVITRFVHPGETVAAGDPIITVADLTRTRIEAEVDEFDAARIRLGASAVIRAEGYDGQWSGTVEEIPDAVTTKRIKPQDTSKPVDTRVLLVKVALRDSTPLKLAQRVEIEFSAK